MSDEALPAPLTPADCDLRDFPHTPIFRSRLFGSSFHARATDAEWRAGVTLWLKSWDQVPAGSLPDDDIELCRLAELARDMKTWRKVKAGALRGWLHCSDGRLYHPVVAEGVNNATKKKAEQRSKTAKARIAALEKHLAKAANAADKERITDEIKKLKQTLSQTIEPSVTDATTDSVTASKRREGEEKGIKEIPSVANATGAEAPDPKDVVFGLGVPLLTAAGVIEKNARSFLAMQCKGGREAEVAAALEACATARPVQPIPWLQDRLKRTNGTAPGKHAGFATKDYREGVNADGSLT